MHGVHDVHGCHTVGAHRGHTLCDRFRALDRRSAYLPSLGIRGARNAMARCHDQLPFAGGRGIAVIGEAETRSVAHRVKAPGRLPKDWSVMSWVRRRAQDLARMPPGR